MVFELQLSSSPAAAIFFAKLCYNICTALLGADKRCRPTVSPLQTRRSVTCASICLVANWPATSRAELANFAALPFGFRARGQKLLRASAFAPRKRGRRDMCEHALSGKLTASAAWGAGRFRCSSNRVSRAGKPQTMRACAC